MLPFCLIVGKVFAGHVFGLGTWGGNESWSPAVQPGTAIKEKREKDWDGGGNMVICLRRGGAVGEALSQTKQASMMYCFSL